MKKKAPIFFGKKGFTLIELLVVISILGLLASIVLVATKGSIDKARVAKILQFSESIFHSLGADAAGVWNFDEGSGTTANDSSGNGNNGDIVGAAYTEETPHKAVGAGKGKYALSFDGRDDYVQAPQVLSGVNTPFTAEAWINPSEITSRWKTVFAEGCTGFDLTILGATLFFGRNCGGSEGVFYAGPTVAANEWTHLAIVYNGTSIDLYKNGVKTPGSSINYTHAPLYIGSYNGATELFNGLIDQVRIYNRALTSFEIQKHYVQSLKKYKNFTIR